MDLPGIDLDATMMRTAAELLGFPPRNIRTIQDEGATLQAVRRELQSLAAATYGADDRVLIYFSGHGTHVPDDNGDEADNKDEALALHDTRHCEGELHNFLRDDEFGRLLDAIPSSNILVLVDADHSGSVTDLGPANHVLLSAAADNELVQATSHGSAFTLGVSEAIKSTRRQGKLTLTPKELQQAAARRITELMEPGQVHTPQLSGDPASLSRNLFRLRRTTPSIFSIYERNQRDGVPNFVTEDLLLASYGLIRVAIGRSLERERYLPQLQRLVTGLQTAVANAPTDAPSDANRDYLAVLAALLAGRNEATGAAKPKRAQAELDLVLAASEIAVSPLWGYRMDYGQFLPRGHYEGDEALTLYFRAVRYAGAALFAVKPSRATGVKRALAKRMAGQAEQLARLLEADAELAAARADLLANLAWRFGPAEDLTGAAVLAVPPKPTRTYAARLFAHAQEHGMKPRIVGGIVERKRLEKGNSALDVLTGWRLLPQYRAVDYAAFQRLVFGGTDAFQGGADGRNRVFGLGVIDGQAVKAFPLLGELMCLYGSGASCEALEQRGETRFAGYTEASERARVELAEAQGLAALHRQLLQVGLRDSARPSRRTAMRAFWTWQRYASVLYAKQSYTPAGKGLPVAKPRPAGARVEPSLALYQSLANVVDGHRRFTPHEAWDSFADVLARITHIASRQQLLGAPSAEDERYLNELDGALKRITGGGDQPIVVDAHVEPSAGQVLEEATGWAVVAETGAARGARFTQCEFKHPLGDRLTDAKWRERLTARDLPRAATSCGQPQPVRADDEPR